QNILVTEILSTIFIRGKVEFFRLFRVRRSVYILNDPAERNRKISNKARTQTRSGCANNAVDLYSMSFIFDRHHCDDENKEHKYIFSHCLTSSSSPNLFYAQRNTYVDRIRLVLGCVNKNSLRLNPLQGRV